MRFGPTTASLRLLSLFAFATAFAALLAIGSTTRTAHALAASSLQTSIQQTQTVTDEYNHSTNWTHALSVPQFNPALGKLVGVSVTRSVSNTNTTWNENTSDNDNVAITITTQSAVSLSAPGVAADLSLVRAKQEGDYTVGPYDGVSDGQGTSGRTLTVPLATETDTVTPADFTAYSGTGAVAFPATASADITNSNSTGNGDQHQSSSADAKVSVTYTYETSAVGDCVWNDLNHNGIQDSGEPGVSGVTVTLYQKGTNTVVGTTTTGANGCYAFNYLPCTAYTVVFSQIPAGFVISPTNAGPSDVDSNGLSSSTDLTGCGIDPTMDLGIYDTTPPPTAVLADSTAPTSTRLRVTKDVIGRTMNFAPGGVVKFRITVTNIGAVTATNVQTCDVLPKYLTFKSTKGITFVNGKACWNVKSLAKGKSRFYSINVKIAKAAPKCSYPVNVATAGAANAKLVRATRRIKVCAATKAASRAPAVTG